MKKHFGVTRDWCWQWQTIVHVGCPHAECHARHYVISASRGHVRHKQHKDQVLTYAR